MHIDPFIILGSAVVGFLVGMTGAGGGALMKPMLILLFGVQPSTAILSDLVAAVMMRPIGAAVHLRQKTVNLSLVGWMVLGSVPMALDRRRYDLGRLGLTDDHHAALPLPDDRRQPARGHGSDPGGAPHGCRCAGRARLRPCPVGTTALGWILCATLLVGASAWLMRTRPWQRLAEADGPVRSDLAAPDGVLTSDSAASDAQQKASSFP